MLGNPWYAPPDPHAWLQSLSIMLGPSLILRHHSFIVDGARHPPMPATTARNRFASLASRCAVLLALTGIASMPLAASTPASAHAEVWAAELAFAQSMADRDLAAFGQLVAEEAIFFAGTTALRGKSKVIEAWAAFFKDPLPPFSWEPDQVEVLDSGNLALSTGPVRDPSGKVIARFNSIWRLESVGKWRVVFDKGSPPSPGPK